VSTPELPAEDLPVQENPIAPQVPGSALLDEAPSPEPQFTAAQLAEIWTRLRASIRQRVQPEQFETWFRRANLVSVNDTVVCIAVQNGFSRDWLRNYYSKVIEDAVTSILERSLKLEFKVDPELTIATSPPELQAEKEAGHLSGGSTPQAAGPDQASEPGPGGPGSTIPGSTAPGNGHPKAPRRAVDLTPDGLVRGSDIGLNPRYTFENFVVGPCNRFSHAVSLGTAEAPGSAYNPLFLHGNVGLGKTHLLQSICFSLLESWKEVRILYLSCETFVNHFISALENGNLQKFRTKYRNVDVLVVDDIHLLANKERTQEEFFHTFNTLYNAGKQIVLSSDSPPKDIPTLQDRLVSRFKWGLVTEIESPCYETRMAILKRKGRERGRDLPESVAHLVAERIDTNIRELEGAVNKLYGFSNVTGQEISVGFAREVLSDLFVKRRGQPSMDDIILLVTEHYAVKLAELQSKKRSNQIAFPRQVAMFLARRITRHSLEEIGGFFGGRDHSTVLYAVDKITKLIEKDPALKELLADFLAQLQGNPP
jgi:chromosomal replication initiator protein